MTVKVFEGAKSTRSGWISRFLKQHQVNHQLVAPEEVGANRSHPRCTGAVEVDGRLFVNPNEDALRKIFQVN